MARIQWPKQNTLSDGERIILKQKDRKTERQKDRNTERKKDRETERQKDEILVQAFNQYGKGPMAKAKAYALSDRECIA